MTVLPSSKGSILPSQGRSDQDFSTPLNEGNSQHRLTTPSRRSATSSFEFGQKKARYRMHDAGLDVWVVVTTLAEVRWQPSRRPG